MKRMIISTVMASLAALLYAMTAHAAPAAPDYAPRTPIRLEGEGKWDYAAIDQLRRRLYLSRGDHVQVLQLPAGRPIAEIADTPRVHGFAFAQDLKLGFVSIGDADSVLVFDLDTMQPRQRIKVGSNPDAILYEPQSRKLYTFNGKSHDVSVVDARTLAVVATLPASGKPEFAAGDGHGRIYFNIEDNAGIGVIDVGSDRIVDRWKLDGCDEPSGLAIDARRHRLFSTCKNRIMAVTDALTGARVATIPIGDHPDAAVFDPDTDTIYTSNGGGTGTLTLIHEDDGDHFRVIGNVGTAKAAKTMAFDSMSKTVYLPTVANGSFSVLVVAPR